MKENPVLALPDFDPADLIDSLADGVYVTDTNRKIVFWNRAAERITGWSQADVVGRSCFDDILGHVDKDGHCLCGQEHCPLHRSIITGCPSEAPVLVFARCKSGRRAPVEVTVAPLRNRLGEIVGGIEVFRDATARIQDLLRAKSIQDLALHCPTADDPRLELEVCHEARDMVGGDFHRVERLADDRLALLVADVMGHGVAAALYTMQLAALWDHHRADLGMPGRFLSILNERLQLVAGDAGFFATAVFATYQPADGGLCLARAGHPAPLVFRRNGTIESIGKAQPALGMLPGIVYQECRGQLEPGDDLLVFSDGAIEVADASEQELGVDGLQRLVKEQQQVNTEGTFHLAALEEQLLRFSNQIHLPDDLTLLKLRRCQ